MQKRIGIIIINWNDYDNTYDCLRSSLDNNRDGFDIILVDNNSSDGSKERLISDFNLTEFIPSNDNCEQKDIFNEDPNFAGGKGNICISLSENYGFTGANNFGIKYLFQNEYFYTLLLNNDTIVGKNFFNDIRKTSELYPKHLVSCRINYFDAPEFVWNMGTYIDYLGMPQGYYHNKKLTNINDRYLETQLSSCCLLLINRSILEKTGGQDHNYFFNIDDSDYTFGAYKLGHPSIIDCNISILHKASMSVRNKPNISTYYYYRNLVYFRRKHFGRINNIVPLIYIYTKIFKSFLISLVFRKRSLVVYKEILLDIYNGKMGRKVITEKSKNS